MASVTLPGELNLPGCRMREVVQISPPRNPELARAGRYLRLECGHEQWVAGFPTKHDHGTPLRRPCLQGPCYREQRFMGSEP